jgi:hypothetical protein
LDDAVLQFTYRVRNIKIHRNKVILAKVDKIFKYCSSVPVIGSVRSAADIVRLWNKASVVLSTLLAMMQ